MRTNTRAINLNRTHEGGMAAPKQAPEVELRRAVASCLLFEQTFYESGSDIAARIADLVKRVPPETVSALAIEARSKWGLRGVSLFLARELARNSRGPLVGKTIEAVIQRADELSEFLSLYWLSGRQPLSAQTKKGLARAFRKFSPYALAKYNRDGKVHLRDALFLSHAKPKDAEQAATWKSLVDKTLAAPDTWEVALSAGTDKRATWERLLTEKKLGTLALLRNLRNMESVGVDRTLILGALTSTSARGILPFQFISAWRAAPAFARGIETAMLAALTDAERLPGSTVLVIDVSGSMSDPLSARGTLMRVDAASALAVLLSEVVIDLRIFTFSERVAEVPASRGLALVEMIDNSQPHSSTYLAQAINTLAQHGVRSDRLIVITDEQTHDGLVGPFASHAYIVNVAPYKPALDTSGGWTRINGFSERLVDWIRMSESDTPPA